MAKAPIKADPNVKITLVCNHLKARFPKLKTARHPRGLVFREGLLDVTHKELIQLEADPDFAYQMQKSTIRILRAGVTVPKGSIPKVVTSRPVSTDEGSGSPAGALGGLDPSTAAESGVEKFDAAAL